MARTVSHKDFVIRIFERQPGCWPAEVRKKDGSRIKTHDGEHEVISVPESLTADDAKKAAIQMIGRGGL